VEAVRVAVRRIESDFLLFPSAGMVGFHPHSMALPVNKPDERAGRFLAPLLEVINSEQSEVLEAGIILREVWAVRICSARTEPRLFGLSAPSIEERERLR
jgi:hypothetical protein